MAADHQIEADAKEYLHTLASLLSFKTGTTSLMRSYDLQIEMQQPNIDKSRCAHIESECDWPHICVS